MLLLFWSGQSVSLVVVDTHITYNFGAFIDHRGQWGQIDNGLGLFWTGRE